MAHSLAFITSVALLSASAQMLSAPAAAQETDIAQAVVVVRAGELEPAEATAAQVLVEEVARRTGITLSVQTAWPDSGPVIALSTGAADSGWSVPVPRRVGENLPENRAEGYRLLLDTSSPDRPVLWIMGADGRGTLYGVGNVLRKARLAQGQFEVPLLDVGTAPEYPIRGHQLGYRNTANSWDRWDVAQFEQYIRDLAIFGANCIENIPFHEDPSPHFPIPREEMNRAMSDICKRYGMDYWVWTPILVDLNDAALREEDLARHEAFYRDTPHLSAVFVPGGDPGENPIHLVLPFLEELAARLKAHHPEARVWLSLQWFDAPQVDQFYRYLDEMKPEWLAGLVAGPSSPPIPETRRRLPAQYQLRHYPDITHTVRCQYPVPWWDPAFGMTLGREPICPQPYYYAHVHNWFAPYTDGFLTYSDGVHDDLNKAVWSACGWDTRADAREAVLDYARLFFGADIADRAADGILALERNWEGPLAQNGAVDGTLSLWREMTNERPDLRENWRWQMYLLRAVYDAYTRQRLLYESGLEQRANAEMLACGDNGAGPAMDSALAVLAQADTTCRPEWRAEITQLCDDLFRSIGLQTSVKKFQASGAERGCVLDYVDYPLNNRWWLEDQFAQVGALPTEEAKCARLIQLATWETPAQGSIYQDIGNVAKCDHVVRGEGVNVDPDMRRTPNPDVAWWDGGYSRARLSWQTYLDWPVAVVFEGLDARDADGWTVRAAGYGDCLLRVNGQRVEPARYDKELGGIKEFPVPAHLVKDGRIVLTFDRPDERHLNWRQHSRLNELWLIPLGGE